MSGPALDTRTAAQLAFLVEADRLKSVERANPLVDGSRRENSAEHSWHVALMALVLILRPAGITGGKEILLRRLTRPRTAKEGAT